MTQYLLSVHHAASGPDLSAEEMQQSFADVDVFNTELQDSGAFVFAGGLLPPESARVVRPSGVTDGPYPETKEHLGGFWVIEAPGLDQALELARKGSVACRLPVEVRQFASEPSA